MENIILIAIIVIILYFASFYIYKAKKRGQKCIGCPNSRNCSAKEKAACCGYGEITEE